MDKSNKVKLAIVANAPSPYRLNLHTRCARELADRVTLHSLFLHEYNVRPWALAFPEEINTEHFGLGAGMVTKGKGLGPIKEWFKMGRVIKRLKELDADVVIVTGYNDPGLLRLIGWCKKAGVPCYMSADSNVYGDRATGLSRVVKKRLVRWAVKRVTGLMPSGRYGEQFFERFGAVGKPMFHVPPTPELDPLFDVTAQRRADAQQKYGLDASRKYFIFSGRLVPVKRVDTLIDAFVSIAASRPDWDVLIVGDGELEAELKARVPEEYKDRFVWTGFIDSHDEISALYTCADVFVLPSSYEPWAVVVLEAAAVGLPVVSSRVVGAAGELCEAENGGVFEPGDVAGLAELLSQVTADEQTLNALRLGSLRVFDRWRRASDLVLGVHKALAHSGLIEAPGPFQPMPPTPTTPPARTDIDFAGCAAASDESTPGASQ